MNACLKVASVSASGHPVSSMDFSSSCPGVKYSTGIPPGHPVRFAEHSPEPARLNCPAAQDVHSVSSSAVSASSPAVMPCPAGHPVRFAEHSDEPAGLYCPAAQGVHSVSSLAVSASSPFVDPCPAAGHADPFATHVVLSAEVLYVPGLQAAQLWDRQGESTGGGREGGATRGDINEPRRSLLSTLEAAGVFGV